MRGALQHGNGGQFERATVRFFDLSDVRNPKSVAKDTFEAANRNEQNDEESDVMHRDEDKSRHEDVSNDVAERAAEVVAGTKRKTSEEQLDDVELNLKRRRSNGESSKKHHECPYCGWTGF